MKIVYRFVFFFAFGLLLLSSGQKRIRWDLLHKVHVKWFCVRLRFLTALSLVAKPQANYHWPKSMSDVLINFKWLVFSFIDWLWVILCSDYQLWFLRLSLMNAWTMIAEIFPAYSTHAHSTRYLTGIGTLRFPFTLYVYVCYSFATSVEFMMTTHVAISAIWGHSNSC